MGIQRAASLVPFRSIHRSRTALCIALLVAATGVQATDGYFSHGYGMKAKGRGGASIAMTGDAFGGANNPATMAFAGDQIALGLDAFSPRREATRSGLGPGLDGTSKSGSNWFPVPEFAWNRMLTEELALGVTLYGNGGMNTDYPGSGFNCGQGESNMLCGMGSLGVDLTQLIVAPTVTYRITPSQSIGVSPLLVYQQFEATGLHAFAGTPGLSAAPDKVTNNGHDRSTGYGLRIGYYAALGDAFSLGFSYASKIRMSRFSDYAGLFADRGRFDLPENYGLGLAWHAASDVTMAMDYVRIGYGSVSSIANSSMAQAQLGSANGPGFGWKDVDVWKLGLEWASSPEWTWRIGYNHSDNPVGGSDVTFNILAPGVVTDHLSLGFTRTLASGGQLTMAYTHAFKNTVRGTSILPAFMGMMPAGTEEISMYQDSIGIQYQW